jgi:DNA repair exonuclease SbcCD ATPase subunit
MIRLIEQTIRNFLSYGNNVTKIPLDFKEPTLIAGENYDAMVDGEFDNNGAGKSSILNALAYTLYGKILEPKVKVDSLINNINKKNLHNTTTFEINGKFYKVERWRKNSKLGGTGNNGVKISVGDSLQTINKALTPATRAIDDYIAESILRMPFEIFVRIVVFSARYEPFLSLPATHTTKPSQTSILEELFSQTELTEKAFKLKGIIKSTNADVTNLIQLNERIEAETSRYNEQLELAKGAISTWNETNSKQISAIKDEIATLEDIDFAGKLATLTELSTVNASITEYRNEWDKIDIRFSEAEKNKTAYDKWIVDHARELESSQILLAPYENINFTEERTKLTKIEEVRKLYDETTALYNTRTSELAVILETVKGLNSEVNLLLESKCPYCNQTFHDNELIIKEKQTELVNAATEYKIKEDEIDGMVTVNVVETIESIDCMFDNMNDLVASENQYNTLKQSLANLKQATNPFELMVMDANDHASLVDRISELKDSISELETRRDELAPHTTESANDIMVAQARLSELKNTLIEKIKTPNPHEETVDRLSKVFENIEEIQTDEVDRLKKLLTHQNFLLKLLTKKDSFLRQALLDVNLPLLNNRLQGYLANIGLPHRVEFTKDMSISITQFNNPIGFANLSGGQQARINLAIAFAFRDVVQARHQKINFCILDECLDTGLSPLGVKLAAKMIKTVAKENDLSMYVITHRDEINALFDSTLTATLRGGLTTVRFS